MKELLLELGFNMNSIVSLYWLDALNFANNYQGKYKMMNIYKDIANKYNTTVSSVERSMRYAVKPAEMNIQQKYNYNNKINNMTFINLVKFSNKK